MTRKQVTYMQINQRPMFQVLHREGGFTLLEVLVAISLLMIAIVGVGFSLSGGGDFGVAAVSRGNSYSTATALAQARIEEIKNATYSATGPTDQITTANFPAAEAYGAPTIGIAGFRRTVTIQNATPAAGMKTIAVQVFFIPEYGTRMGQEENVQVSTIIAQRP